MIDSILNNISWVFSGIGVFILAGVVALFRKKLKAHHTSDGSASISDTIIKGKNINININTNRNHSLEKHNLDPKNQKQNKENSKIRSAEMSKLKIIDSFPKDGQSIRTSEVKDIYLKFNKPIDKSTACYIVNYFVKTNSIIQWDICGWIQFAEDDSKLIWHVKDNQLDNKDNYGSMDVDYHTFEIHVGRSPETCWILGKDGSRLPQSIIKVYIDKNYN